MTPFWRGLLLTILLAAIAAGGGTWLGARYVYQQRHQPTLHEFVHEKLDLSTEQERRLEVLEQDFVVRRRGHEAELRQANAELAAAIQAKHEFSPEVRAAVDRFHEAMGKQQNETILHVLAMRRILTPEQARRFDRRVGEALTEPSP